MDESMKATTVLLSMILCGTVFQDPGRPRTIPREVEVSLATVSLSGRWIADQEIKSPLLAKVNSTTVTCDRKAGTCTEALAALVSNEDEPRLKGQLLQSLLTVFVVESWSDTAIRASSIAPAAEVTLEIRFQEKVAHRFYRARKVPSGVLRWHLE